MFWCKKIDKYHVCYDDDDDSAGDNDFQAPNQAINKAIANKRKAAAIATCPILKINCELIFL